jgi:hypothetical protein
VLLLALAGAANAVAFGISAGPQPKGLAADCLGGASLAPGSHHEVDWVIWCGPANGRFDIQFHPGKKTGPFSVGDDRTVTGPGAGASPTCARREGEVFCHVRKSGPVTVRGTFKVPGNACVEYVSLWIHVGERADGEGNGGKPWGCPGSEPPGPPTVAHIVSFYEHERLAPALRGTHAAVMHKAYRLRRAWIAEEPVARWANHAWGAPLDTADAEELTLRLATIGQADRLIHRWLARTHLSPIYAGWTWGPEGTIYVGFTRKPVATLARLREAEPFLAPSRLKPFPVPPTYSEAELWALAKKVTDALIKLEEEEPEAAKEYGFTYLGIDTLANKVRVGALHVAPTRRWVTELFGEEAPIEVVKVVRAKLL